VGADGNVTLACLQNLRALGVVGTVFPDLRKAFDTVNHNILIRKMSHFNLSAGSLALMKSYLEGRTQCVRVGEAVSAMLEYEVGVPQG